MVCLLPPPGYAGLTHGELCDRGPLQAGRVATETVRGIFIVCALRDGKRVQSVC